MKTLFNVLFIFVFSNILLAQNKKGIHFQGIARSETGMIVANKQIALRISILNDTLPNHIAYQEIKSVTTNVLGLFYTDIGIDEVGKIITIGSFDQIKWEEDGKYIQVEVDPNNSLHFLEAGLQQINYVPYSIYAEQAKFAEQAKTISSIIPVELGGTGVSSKLEMLKSIGLEKVNNTPDSIKPISVVVGIALNEKLKKADTLSLSNRINIKLNAVDTLKLSNRINLKLNIVDTNTLSNRINTKLNSSDTLGLFNRINNKLNSSDTTSLSNRINAKLNSSDTLGLFNRINNKLNSSDTTSLSNRINMLSTLQPKNNYGFFYDTTKQTALVSTATAVKFNFQQITNKINITNNSANNPTRINFAESGIYQINYSVQFIKSDAGTDEVNIWFRKTNAAIANTNTTYTIQGVGVKNNIANSFLLELAANDYIELFFSVKNANSSLQGTVSTTVTPSRPATPAASISIHAVNE
jgi:hypothetical protein